MKPKKPIFYFEKFDSFDKWTLGGYLIISMGLFLFLKYAENDAYKYGLTTAYIYLSPLALYGVFYKSLRNMSVFAAWNVIGLLHLGMYVYFKNDWSLRLLLEGVIENFKNTNLLLCVFQLLRIISLKVQNKELVGAPIKGSSTDIFDEREVNFLDLLLFLIYLACFTMLAEIND